MTRSVYVLLISESLFGGPSRGAQLDLFEELQEECTWSGWGGQGHLPSPPDQLNTLAINGLTDVLARSTLLNLESFVCREKKEKKERKRTWLQSQGFALTFVQHCLLLYVWNMDQKGLQKDINYNS